MPKKKTTIIEEETPQEENTPEIEYKDIKGKTFEEVATTSEPEEKKEETPEEKPETKEEETEEIEFDPEQLKQEAIEAAEKKLLDRLTGNTGEETKENVDEYQSWAESFAQTHGGQAPTWKDAMQWMEERAVTKLEERQAAKAKEEEEKRVAAQTEEDKRMESVNTYVDDQMNDLYTSGKFPRIQNKEDQNDTGVLFRKALMEQTMLINKERIDKGLPTKTLKEVFYEDFKAPTRQPAGVNAPVSAGRGAATSGEEGELDYIKDVRDNRLLNSIFRRRG